MGMNLYSIALINSYLPINHVPMNANACQHFIKRMPNNLVRVAIKLKKKKKFEIEITAHPHLF